MAMTQMERLEILSMSFPEDQRRRGSGHITEDSARRITSMVAPELLDDEEVS